jgi:hypothetical protein
MMQKKIQNGLISCFFLCLGIEGLSEAHARDFCEEARMEGKLTKSTELQLRILSQQEEFRTLHFYFRCDFQSTGELSEFVNVGGLDLWLEDELSQRPYRIFLKKFEFHSLTDDPFGQVTPSISVTFDFLLSHEPFEAFRKELFIRWSERAPYDLLFGSSLKDVLVQERTVPLSENWTPLYFAGTELKEVPFDRNGSHLLWNPEGLGFQEIIFD